MLVSGVIASAALAGILVVLFVAGIALAVVDKHLDLGREH